MGMLSNLGRSCRSSFSEVGTRFSGALCSRPLVSAGDQFYDPSMDIKMHRCVNLWRGEGAIIIYLGLGWTFQHPQKASWVQLDVADSNCGFWSCPVGFLRLGEAVYDLPNASEGFLDVTGRHEQEVASSCVWEASECMVLASAVA